ncbi:MAG: IS481 family transposase [Planctomycetaceae bacterium]
MLEEFLKSEGVPEGTPSPALPAASSVESSTTPLADDEPSSTDWESFAGPTPLPRGVPPKTKRRRLTLPELLPPPEITPPRRLLILDTWRRSGLPAGDFAVLVGVSTHTLYAWKKRFEEEGPAGLMDRPRGVAKGSKLPDLTKRAILMMKEANPDWGCQRISDMLVRGPALPASPSAVLRVLHEAGYQLEETPTKPHPDQVRRFERAHPSELWQTDLFTFVLKRQNRRVYLVAFMDDHSRFITGFGLHASQSAALVLEVLRAAITSYGNPQEILTDNGTQYVTWRGKSAFARELEKRGIRHVVASPRRPQTLGKIERFWGTLWRECLETSVFLDLGEARTRIGHFIDHYNFKRPHQGADGLVPADRFFGAAPEVLRTLKERVAANSLELARQGVPRSPFYLTGNVGGRPFSVHAEGERVILTREGEQRAEVDLVGPADASVPPAPEPAAEASAWPTPVCPDGSPEFGLADETESEPPAPGVSPLDEAWPPTSSADDAGGAS